MLLVLFCAGPLPSALSKWHINWTIRRVFDVDLSYNLLSGPVPDSLTSWRPFGKVIAGKTCLGKTAAESGAAAAQENINAGQGVDDNATLAGVFSKASDKSRSAVKAVAVAGVNSIAEAMSALPDQAGSCIGNLFLHHNKLNGTLIPRASGRRWAAWRSFSFASNMLTGSLQDTLEALQGIKFLDLTENLLQVRPHGAHSFCTACKFPAGELFTGTTVK